MVGKIKEAFGRGIERIRWFSSLLSERTKIEIAVIRLLYQSDKIEKKRVELLKTIGQRVYELKGYADKDIIKDSVVVQAIDEIDRLEKTIDELKSKASDMSRVTD